MFNQMADDIIAQTVRSGAESLSTGYQLVRLYALVNVGMAEAAIAVRSCLTLFFSILFSL